MSGGVSGVSSAGVDALKLSCYFGERERTDGRLVADGLLDLFGSERMKASILLRGIEGFGLRHHLRTDRLLTLSEDLPAVAIALDERQRIETILPAARALMPRGLITLERASLLDSPFSLPQAQATCEQLRAGSSALKLTLHLGRHHRSNGGSGDAGTPRLGPRRGGRGAPAFLAACEILHGNGAAGATALLGVDGTRSGARHRARLVGRNEDVPLVVMSVGEEAPILDALPHLADALPEALVTLERVRVCRRDGAFVSPPHEPASILREPEPGKPPRRAWQKLTIVTSESALHDGAPIHLQLIRRLRSSGLTGATSLRGIWGFHGDHAPHGDRLLSLRRHVPVLTVVVDEPKRIEEAFPVVEELTSERGLVTSELVPAMRAAAGSAERGDLRIGGRLRAG